MKHVYIWDKGKEYKAVIMSLGKPAMVVDNEIMNFFDFTRMLDILDIKKSDVMIKSEGVWREWNL